MVITKTALPRRTFLRGLGASLALPWLDAMMPVFGGASLRAATTPIPRMGFFVSGNGIYMPTFLPAASDAALDLTTSPTLKALAPLQEQVVLVTGLASAEADGSGAGLHSRAASVWLNGTRIVGDGAATNVRGATTLDQYAARVLGEETPLRSLELALEPSGGAGVCEAGFSCVYLNTFSWRTPTTPLPMESNPRAVFDRLFGGDRNAAAREQRLSRERSILDSIREEMTGLQRRLGVTDRSRLDDYLGAVRDVERQIQMTEQRAFRMPDFEYPQGIPESAHEHAKLMLDLLYLAYRSDTTRVATFQIARGLSNRSYGQIGVPEGHHELSHHGGNAQKIEKLAKIDAYNAELFAAFLQKLRETPDGEGSLLDHSLFLYGGDFGDGQNHSPHNLPILVAGGACGRLRGGRHLKAPTDTPLMNLGLSLLEKVDVELASIGDSTGRLADL